DEMEVRRTTGLCRGRGTGARGYRKCKGWRVRGTLALRCPVRIPARRSGPLGGGFAGCAADKRFCHFERSRRCAFVCMAPTGHVIRVRESRTDTGKGVDREDPNRTDGRDL